MAQTKKRWYESSIIPVVLIIIILGTPVMNMAMGQYVWPLPALPIVRSAYNEVVNVVAKGGTILFIEGNPVTFSMAVMPLVRSYANHIVPLNLEKKVRVIYMTNQATGPVMIDEWYMIPLYGENYKNHPLYGEYFVNLGYISLPSEPTWIAWGRDILGKSGNKDTFGNDLRKMPIMEDIKTVGDIDLIVKTDFHAETSETNVLLWVPEFGVRIIGEDDEQMGQGDYAYYIAGLLKGGIIGTMQACMYESLTGIPGPAQRLNLGLILIVIFIIVGIVSINVQLYVLPKVRRQS